MSNEIKDYWDKRDALPEPAKTIVLKHWDETGRPTFEHISQAIGDVLNECDTFDEFVTLYKQVFPESTTDDSIVGHWNIYARGFKRCERIINDNMKKVYNK